MCSMPGQIPVCSGQTNKLRKPSLLPSFLPRATARLCQKGDASKLSGICCGRWEESADDTDSELGPPALVLCDGLSLLRIPRSGFSTGAPVEQVFEIQGLGEETADDRVIDIHFLSAADDSPAVSAFLVLQSHRLYRLPWPPDRGSSEKQDVCYADCQYVVSVTATHQAGLIFGGGVDGAFSARADGRLEAVAYPAIEQTHMVAATALSDMWAILCGRGMAQESGHAWRACHSISCCVLLALRTLEMLACIDLQCSANGGGCLHLMSLNNMLLLAGNCRRATDSSPACPALVSWHVAIDEVAQKSPCSGAAIALHADVCWLEEIHASGNLVATASVLEHLRILALGLSDGTIVLLREFAQQSTWQTCGCHSVAACASTIVACGFVAWKTHAAVTETLALAHGLFAASEDGARRLWLSGVGGSEPTGAREHVAAPQKLQGSQLAPSSAEAAVAAPRRRSDDKRHLHQDARNLAPSGKKAEGSRPAESSRRPLGPDNKLDLDLNAVSSFVPPLPSHSELEALIDLAVREIAELEEQEEQLVRNKPATIQPELSENSRSDGLPPLAPVAAPSPPKLARVPRAQVHHDLLDPLEVTRAYLARSCRPVVQPQALLPLPSAASQLARTAEDIWENSIESLSFNPLEHHIKSLCRP